MAGASSIAALNFRGQTNSGGLALALSIAIHERCTNAAHCGTPWNGAGRIKIDWTPSRTAPDLQLLLRWEKTAGPLVTVPASRTVRNSGARTRACPELGARVRLQFPPQGVVSQTEAPLTRATT